MMNNPPEMADDGTLPGFGTIIPERDHVDIRHVPFCLADALDMSRRDFHRDPLAFMDLMRRKLEMGEQFCWACGKDAAPNRCSRCKMGRYCNSECQKKDRKFHVPRCKDGSFDMPPPDHVLTEEQVQENDREHAKKVAAILKQLAQQRRKEQEVFSRRDLISKEAPAVLPDPSAFLFLAVNGPLDQFLVMNREALAEDHGIMVDRTNQLFENQCHRRAPALLAGDNNRISVELWNTGELLYMIDKPTCQKLTNLLHEEMLKITPVSE